VFAVRSDSPSGFAARAASLLPAPLHGRNSNPLHDLPRVAHGCLLMHGSWFEVGPAAPGLRLAPSFWSVNPCLGRACTGLLLTVWPARPGAENRRTGAGARGDRRQAMCFSAPLRAARAVRGVRGPLSSRTGRTKHTSLSWDRPLCCSLSSCCVSFRPSIRKWSTDALWNSGRAAVPPPPR